MSEPAPETPAAFVSHIGVVATARVDHVAPCTPDCKVCYPEGDQ
jgi:hypothetical protein